MSCTTKIAWTDRTFNPWIGCTQISPGCDRCYAKSMAERFAGLYGAGTWSGQHYQIADAGWKKPHSWNRKAVAEGKRSRVFCASMADVFDNKASPAARERLWGTIRTTPALDWLLLTKRAANIVKFLPEDWGAGYLNVWLGVSCEDRKHGFPRVDVLRQIPAVVRFVSVEPLLEDIGDIDLTGVDWLIVGGESGPGCRPMAPDWARALRDRCDAEGIAYFYKQAGGPRGGGHLLDGEQRYAWPEPRAAE